MRRCTRLADTPKNAAGFRLLASGSQTGRILATLLLTAGVTASGQSDGLRDAVRLHAHQVESRAQDELAACIQTSCPQRNTLSLLTGYLLLSSGDARGAATQLLSSPAPAGLGAFHAYYLAEALAYSGETLRAQRGFAFVARQAPAWLARKALAREAEMLGGRGRWVECLLRLEQLPESLPAELLFLRAQAELQLGRGPEGLADLRMLLLRTPTHPLADEAEALLVAETPSHLPWSLEDRLNRARRLLDAGAPGKALTELDTLDIEKLSRGAPAQARVALLRAITFYALGKEADGAKALQLAMRGPSATAAEAAMFHARRVMREQNTTAGQKEMAEVARRFPREAFASEATFLAGWLDLQRGELAPAARALADYADKFPHSQFRDDALWFSSLALLHLGQPAAARTSLLRLETLYPHSTLVPQAHYWAARALQLQVPAGDARGEYQDVLRLYPGSLYALFAEQRLLELGVHSPPGFPPPRVPETASVKAGKTLQLAQSLSQAGLQRDAAEELQGITDSTHGSADALAMGEALQRLGEYGVAYSLAARSLWGMGFGERRPEALALFFPRAYATTVEAVAPENHIHPYMVWAIMRRESGFQPDRISAANARGLMQIIPKTASAIAEQKKLPQPAPDELYAPALNLELGGWYLGKLWERFGHPGLVAAAYNAGPQPALRWTGARGGEPLDLFVEDIPFKETRAYVKQVMADYFNYFTLYGKPEQKPAWSWEVPKPRESGVSF